MYISASAARLSNCTFAGNEATTGTGGVYLSGSLTIDVVNSILWGNDGPTSAQIVKSTSTPLNISHCFVEGGWISGVPEEVYDLDPQFIDSASGDYRLASGSPALDFGMNEGNAPMPSTDLDGLPRIVNDVVDLGAYEFQGEAPSACPGDLDGNGTVEFADLLDQLQSWGSCSGCAADLNQDGLVDFDDVLALLQLWGSCP